MLLHQAPRIQVVHIVRVQCQYVVVGQSIIAAHFQQVLRIGRPEDRPAND